MNITDDSISFASAYCQKYLLILVDEFTIIIKNSYYNKTQIL